MARLRSAGNTLESELVMAMTLIICAGDKARQTFVLTTGRTTVSTNNFALELLRVPASAAGLGTETKSCTDSKPG